jgi:hypothetical protein
MTFNVQISSCIAFGALASKVLEPLNLGSEKISWNRYLKYLGVNFIRGEKLTLDTEKIKGSFLQLAIVYYLMYHIVMKCSILIYTRSFFIAYFITRMSGASFHPSPASSV